MLNSLKLPHISQLSTSTTVRSELSTSQFRFWLPTDPETTGTQPFLEWVQKRCWAGCHLGTEERMLWCLRMSPSGLKYKLSKMANSIVLWRTLQPRTSWAEELLGSESFIAPRKNKNYTWTHKIAHSHACALHNHLSLQTHTRTHGVGCRCGCDWEHWAISCFFLSSL